MSARWRSLILRSVIAALVTWILTSIPLPSIARHTWVAFVQVPIVVFLLICYIGKLLIDTFFYEHHIP